MTTDYGTFRLTYTPPETTSAFGYPDIAIEMSTSGEANVEQMLRFYEAFLAAAGYVLKGELQVVKEVKESSETLKFEPRYSLYGDFWNDDGFSFVGNPFPSANSSDSLVFS